MTLIVSAIEGTQVWMVSETAITDPKVSLRDRIDLPKIFPIQGRSLVGFAGDVTYGLQAIRAISSIEPGQATLEALIREHRENQSVDFAYAYMEDSVPRLFKISEGVANSVIALFLGQQAAFETFQKMRHDISIDHAPNAIHKFLSDDISDQGHEAIIAMLRLFSSTSEREVGGWVLPYILSAQGTRLCSYAFSVSDPIVDQLKPGDIIPHGTAAAGGFELSVTELRERDGVVVYWLQKPGGQIWINSSNNYEVNEFDGSPSVFTKAVKESLGRDIDLWLSEEDAGLPQSIVEIQDQKGHPRVAVVKSGNKLTFSWIQNSQESFKGNVIVKNENENRATYQNGVSATVSGDPERVVIKLADGDTPKTEISVDATQLDQIIEYLSTIRMSLKTTVPTELASGVQLPAIIDPLWRTRPIFHDGFQGCLLVFRHTGFGWIPFFLPTDEVIKLGEWLINAANPPDSGSAPREK
jgi:hypothetical protein